MSKKKFFSLLHGDQIHVAPETKVLSADAFSSLLTAEEVLEQIKKDAEQYRLEVVKECEKLKEQAQKEGFEVGLQQWTEMLTNLENQIGAIRKETEQQIIPIALKAAKKIVSREIELSPQTVVDIVSNNLKAVAAHKKIVVYANKKDVDVLEKNKPQLKQIFENVESLAIRERADVAQGGCIIETEGGIINAQIDTLWSAFERAFEVLLKANPRS